MDQIETIEIAVRSVIVQELSDKCGTHWFLEDQGVIWSNCENRAKWLSKIKEDLNNAKKQKEPSIVHYKNKYSGDEYPPAWVIAECISFQKWSMLYKQLKHGKSKIASSFEDQLSPEVFASWLHSLSVLRNCCAHHSRLWDRKFSTPVKVHPKHKKHFDNPGKFYAHAVSIRILTKVINNDNRLRDSLKDLFHSYSNIIEPSMLGFIEEWDSDLIWN